MDVHGIIHFAEGEGEGEFEVAFGWEWVISSLGVIWVFQVWRQAWAAWLPPIARIIYVNLVILLWRRYYCRYYYH